MKTRKIIAISVLVIVSAAAILYFLSRKKNGGDQFDNLRNFII